MYILVFMCHASITTKVCFKKQVQYMVDKYSGYPNYINE